MKKNVIIMASLSLAFTACNNNADNNKTAFPAISVTYPDTRKDTTVWDDYFGTKVADPYRWLENDTSAETAAWVKAENDVTQGYLSKIPFRDAIKKRYEALYNYEKYSAPFKEGQYTYYYKNTGLQNQSVVYRETAGNTTPEIFLDPNSFSADGTTSLAGIAFSKDGSLAAYNISEGGSDWQKIVIIDAVNKKQTGDTLQLKFSGASWKGNDGFYYSNYDRSAGNVLSAKNENHKLYYHKLGTPQKDDILIYGNDAAPVRYMGGYLSEDEKWLIISTANETYGNALYVQDIGKPGSPVVPIVTNMKNSYNIVDVDDNYFYIQTDLDAPTNKLVAVPVNNPADVSKWKTIIDAKPEVLNVSSGGGFLFATYMKDAVNKVYQFDRTGKQIREIKLPGLGTANGFYAKQHEKELFYVFTSYVNPPTIYKLDIASGNTSVYKESKVQFNPADYQSEQVFYTSKDGTKIPMIITRKKGTELNGKNPCLLYGYGGFGISLTPNFNTSILILLENGGVYAVPNLRGGGEYGEEWHNQGIKTKKQNVFDDFIAAASYLVDNKYTSREMLAIRGGSNGGLLIGACITQQPGMCKVALPAVGVMDMLRYHKFTAGAGWAYDYGTSADSKEMFEYLYHYSPLHNLKEANYPATLISTADHDDRVVPAHSFKFAATMQKSQKGLNPVLIRIETKAGHGAGKSTQQILQEQADMWSFMFYNLGVKPKY